MKLLTTALMAIAVGFNINHVQADVFSGFQGSIDGGIPAYTRDINANNKPYWCTQRKLLQKSCSVVSISSNKRVAIVTSHTGSKACPGGFYGVVDRANGDAMDVFPTKGQLNIDQVCSTDFKVGFIKPANRNTLASVALYYKGKIVDVFDYSE
ncbi:hypothetical protein [Citrobacter farmeri]|uniref:hypothetical protein n=1 Tax=Citrobacter farmeri TaxID=67824 RepID=UPI00189A44E5|nr:hypothetical protein [Citrobacter farmeri]MDB2170261.1 hypothetical protein [Citrobacter farmeri]